MFSTELMNKLNLSIDKLSQMNWADFSDHDKNIVFGLLSVVGGWTPSLRTGQLVLAEINNQQVEAIVVDDGLGKKRVSVILANDSSL
mmetsp:Transcript_23267/g.22850  ORF Transcript_23267/g.22850 Transcript_23267/m.22850 type:complete len:87 (-) Transcript_23267:121-381(-)